MKRSGPPKRKTPMRADPETTRAFVQRGRENARRNPATAPSDFRDDEGRVVPGALGSAPVAVRMPGAPKGGRVPLGARKEALARTHGVCVTCPAKAVQVHHVLPRNKWPHLAKVAANLIGTCVDCHARHESAFTRFPRSVLPAETLALAEAEGLTWYIDRVYPA